MNELEKDWKQSIKTLKTGGVLLYPTDTVWGLGCDATNKKAISRIFDIKERSKSKSMIILVSNPEMLQNYVVNPSEKLIELMRSASTPTTGIFPVAKNLPDNLINQDGSIAIRIASDQFCPELISRFGKPIVSTSANISQQPSPQFFSEMNPILLEEVDYTVFYRREDNIPKTPSHIIKLGAGGEVERIR